LHAQANPANKTLGVQGPLREFRYNKKIYNTHQKQVLSQNFNPCPERRKRDNHLNANIGFHYWDSLNFKFLYNYFTPYFLNIPDLEFQLMQITGFKIFILIRR
jgi:hypothetical protein